MYYAERDNPDEGKGQWWLQSVTLCHWRWHSGCDCARVTRLESRKADNTS